jgi:molybdopterin synthase catalytic subunit
LLGVMVIHSHGKIQVGENIVSVIVASSQRQAAFAAVEFLMVWLKSLAPFWKRGHHADRTVGEWLEAKNSDELAVRSCDGAPNAHEHEPHRKARCARHRRG